MVTTKRKSMGEWISSHILPIVSITGIVGGGLLTFYLTVYDNTNDIKSIRTTVAALQVSTNTQIEGVDDDIDEAIGELSTEVFQTLRVFDEALFVVEDEVEASSDTLIGVSRDISTLQRDYEQLDGKIDQQLINQQSILNAISNLGN